MDFILDIYNELLLALQAGQHKTVCFRDHLFSRDDNSSNSSVILRHDVDRFPNNALKMARLEHGLGIRATYYFRAVPESFDREVICRVAELGHEVGYHYEDVDLVVKRQKAGGNRVTNEEELIDAAMESFVKNLEKLREICPVETVCMHGSPLSRYDNRLLWEKYNYRDYDIIGEPYFDIDFSEVAYYTDTGRCWNGERVSVRDKVGDGGRSEQTTGARQYITATQPQVSGNRYPQFRTTKDMIDAVNAGTFPPKAMLTVHPQRWHDTALPWVWELLWQNAKNLGKQALIRSRK